MTNPQFDGQWLDFYALLEVPVNADEDAIRKRIGKVYAEASAQSDHRDLPKRHYYRSLVESVLPQCRRVLLDPQWRAKYDRQHILHSIGDPSAQDYVSFIASMRGGNDLVLSGDALLPQRIQEEISAARAVVETAATGAELELLPAQAISVKADSPKPAPEIETFSAPIGELGTEKQTQVSPAKVSSAETLAGETEPKKVERVAPTVVKVESSPRQIENIEQKGQPARAKVLTAQEASDIRRRRSSNPDLEEFAAPNYAARIPKTKKAPTRVVVEKTAGRQRVISPTSLNLMVAITGVLLTITIQRFAETPAVATNQARTPIFVSAAPQIAAALSQTEAQFENSVEGAAFDLVISAVDGDAGVRRALGRGGEMPDAWIPVNALWLERYNQQAPRNRRPALELGASIAQTPMVLVARADRAKTLRTRFPDRRIASWSALRQAVISDAPGRFGLPDPQKTAAGALARFSMAREWAANEGISSAEAASKREFWRWMNGFEENTPTNATSVTAMTKDLALGTTGRFWWAIAYESDALEWIGKGSELELFYLPRTTLADYPFVPVERAGAGTEVARGRAAFERFLRSQATQKALLKTGFRPTEIAPTTDIEGNPFTDKATKNRGARVQGLPRDERPSERAIETLAAQWAKRFG